MDKQEAKEKLGELHKKALEDGDLRLAYDILLQLTYMVQINKDKADADKDVKIEKLHFVNGLMREMLEHQRKNMASIGIRATVFPDFVYEVI